MQSTEAPVLKYTDRDAVVNNIYTNTVTTVNTGIN